MYPNFGKKGPNCVHVCVKFSIQNSILIVSRRKNSKMFPCGTFFSCVFDEMFMEALQFHEASPALKVFGCVPALRHYSLYKTLHLKRLCLNNCSVICTVTLSHVLHQSYSEFWHIQNSVYSGIFSHIQAQSALLRHIHRY